MWDDIKELVGSAAPLVGSLIGGPLGGSVGSLIADKLGVEDKPEAILEKLQTDPAALLKIKQMESEERQQLRQLTYKQAELESEERKHQHETTQKTIQTGDTAEDEYVRRTRPKMARWSFYIGTTYLFLFEIAAGFDFGSGASEIMLGTAYGPAFTYMGMRTIDAFSKHKGPKMGNLVKQVVNARK
jgi:gas vesicle protein